jgi:hypothetical protein
MDQGRMIMHRMYHDTEGSSKIDGRADESGRIQIMGIHLVWIIATIFCT